MSATHAATPQQPPGYPARRIAADILAGVLLRKRPFDEQLEASGIGALPERDRALVRAIAATVLRRLGTMRQLLMPMLERGVPREAPQLESIILVGAAQILFLGVPDHAAVDLSVRMAQASRYTARYAGLVNAVLRRTAREGKVKLAGLDAAMLDAPDWLTRRWIDRYGEPTVRAIAAAHAREPALDLTVKHTPELWAAQLNGRVLPTGTVRIASSGPVAQLAGFNEGEWWVQDAAAAIRSPTFAPHPAARPHSSFMPGPT
jgi:16S rRNA (cytosine967-C5)-methyltransferase